MSRVPIMKELIQTRLASTYGSWIYCDSCGENIGYLCYVTYNRIHLVYQCQCGSRGSLSLAFEEDSTPLMSDQSLLLKKNRLCCPKDNSPLFTLLNKKLVSYNCEVACAACGTTYKEEWKCKE